MHIDIITAAFDTDGNIRLLPAFVHPFQKILIHGMTYCHTVRYGFAVFQGLDVEILKRIGIFR